MNGLDELLPLRAGIDDDLRRTVSSPSEQDPKLRIDVQEAAALARSSEIDLTSCCPALSRDSRCRGACNLECNVTHVS